ncbi:hypothetical protein [Haloarchaeobius sp. HME9146]|uniref:hypothetical protein n=1 Tax=Haloarchaeobius sp. HME9146 TaxID=2978732 RepID=UPI0021BE124D|nr:hypothetical protein [Haloarchaeobius sp. HME9146]MCT9097252.1 hypothetical protein [Haloarchaeobius sp. HME9146]
MPSEDSRIYPIATVSLGVLLLATAVFAPIGSIAWTYEYNAEPVPPDEPNLTGRLAWIDEAAVCGPSTPACVLGYRVRDGGPRVVSDETYRAARGFDSETELVIFYEHDPAFYQPTVRHYENDTTRVSLRSVSNATALDLVSTPARHISPGVQRLVEEGTVRTATPLDGYSYWSRTHAVVAHDGRYYSQGRYRYRGTHSGAAENLRLAALAGGAALCFIGGRIA